MMKSPMKTVCGILAVSHLGSASIQIGADLDSVGLAIDAVFNEARTDYFSTGVTINATDLKAHGCNCQLFGDAPEQDWSPTKVDTMDKICKEWKMKRACLTTPGWGLCHNQNGTYDSELIDVHSGECTTNILQPCELELCRLDSYMLKQFVDEVKENNADNNNIWNTTLTGSDETCKKNKTEVSFVGNFPDMRCCGFAPRIYRYNNNMQKCDMDPEDNYYNITVPRTNDAKPPQLMGSCANSLGQKQTGGKYAGDGNHETCFEKCVDTADTYNRNMEACVSASTGSCFVFWEGSRIAQSDGKDDDNRCMLFNYSPQLEE